MIKRCFYICCFVLIGLQFSCEKKQRVETFSDDLEFLRKNTDAIVLQDGNRQVIVSPKLQGRILVSTSKGLEGSSYGWYKKALIKSDSLYKNISKVCGASRIWFGPDFGENDVFAEMDSITKKVVKKAPKDLNEVPFQILEQSLTSLLMGGQLHLKNIKNFNFYIDVKRKISLLDSKEVERNLNVPLNDNVDFVAFRAETSMENIGKEDWNKEEGVISLWELGCMQPTPKTTVVIPLRGNAKEATIYFTPLDSTRIKIENNTLYYRADANYLNKIGTLPEYTKPYFGSYSPELELLTIVRFSFSNEQDYVNAHPEGKLPYRGDVINIFNDGEWPDGGPFGPFYELESSSPAKALKIGENISHYQETYHFEGAKEKLSSIAMKVFGVSINEIESALP